MSVTLNQLHILKDSLLPFLLIVDYCGIILSSGASLDKMANKRLESTEIDKSITFDGHSYSDLLKKKDNTLIKFTIRNTELYLKGTFHNYKEEKAILILCIPIFNSNKTLSSSKLNLSDFSEASVMAEYLFLIESNTSGLNEAYNLIEKVNEKNKNIQKAFEEIENISRFPDENPHPVIRISLNGTFLFANQSAINFILSPLSLKIGDTIPKIFFPFINKVTSQKEHIQELVVISKKTFSFNFIQISNREYINIYAIDITQSKNEIEKKNKQLEIAKNTLVKLNENLEYLVNKKTKALNLALGEIQLQQSEQEASIRYAKTLQSAILPKDNTIPSTILESFTIYKPKDVIGGDFYGSELIGDFIYLYAADCTGHGIPGAMLTFICSNALNIARDTISETSSANILNKTRELVIQRFEKSEETVNDGMDISFCIYNKKTKILEFAGANSSLIIIKKLKLNVTENDMQSNNHLLRKIKGDSQPIGNYFKMEPFTNNRIQLESSDSFYLFSDGYPDQFGGKKNKKFGYKKFRNLLLNIQDKTTIEKENILHETFTNWKGGNEQIDDVLVYGFNVV